MERADHCSAIALEAMVHTIGAMVHTSRHRFRYRRSSLKLAPNVSCRPNIGSSRQRVERAHHCIAIALEAMVHTFGVMVHTGPLSCAHHRKLSSCGACTSSRRSAARSLDVTIAAGARPLHCPRCNGAHRCNGEHSHATSLSARIAFSTDRCVAMHSWLHCSHYRSFFNHRRRRRLATYAYAHMQTAEDRRLES